MVPLLTGTQKWPFQNRIVPPRPTAQISSAERPQMPFRSLPWGSGFTQHQPSLVQGCLATKAAWTSAGSMPIGTSQVPVPLHAPAQPPKTDCSSACAVSTTRLPGGGAAVQVGPQSIAASPLTLPPPSPIGTTCSRQPGSGLASSATESG